MRRIFCGFSQNECSHAVSRTKDFFSLEVTASILQSISAVSTALYTCKMLPICPHSPFVPRNGNLKGQHCQVRKCE